MTKTKKLEGLEALRDALIIRKKITNVVKVLALQSQRRLEAAEEWLANAKDDSEILSAKEAVIKDFGIIIHERKTRIVKLSSFYRHLQNGYSLTETGRLILKINPKNITRERRKLKAYKRLLDAGKITYSEVENIFKS